jgi:hypothetical protein
MFFIEDCNPAFRHLSGDCLILDLPAIDWVAFYQPKDKRQRAFIWSVRWPASSVTDMTIGAGLAVIERA